jgi:hypothetical protein
MASIRLIVEYEGYEAEERILIKHGIQELIRRVRVKNSPCINEEVSHQVAGDINAEIIDKNILKKLVHSIVAQLSQE